MKKLFFLIIASYFLFLPADSVFAVSSSNSATVVSSDSAHIEDLKERLATKVAELRDEIRKAIHGKVASVSITTASVDLGTKTLKVELPDEIKVIQVIKGKRTELTTEDVTKDDVVTVFGKYDTTLELLKAKVIFIEPSSTVERISGVVTNVDTDAYAITIRTSEGRTVVCDIEKTTKTLAKTTDGSVTKSGFSKITEGDTVHITGTPIAKKENRLSVSRILDIGNLTAATATPTITPSPMKESSPSATPGKKQPTPTKKE